MANELKKYAYVSLVTSVSYFPGMVAVAKSFFHTRSPFPLIVITTDALPQEHQLILEKLGCEVRCLERLQPPANAKPFNPALLDAFTKLKMFNFTEFDKIVYLDADLVLVSNIDELFDLPSFSAVAQFQGMRKKNGKVQAKFSAQTFNTGVLVLEPSLAIYEKILDAFTSYQESWSWADQDLLVNLFRSEWTHLPWEYNAQKRMFLYRPDLWNADRQNIKIIHYIGGKPWQSEEELKSDFEDNSPYRPIFELWQRAYTGDWPLIVPNSTFELDESLRAEMNSDI